MPRIGNVEVGDDVVAALGAPAAPAARPSLGAILASSARQAYGQVRYGVPLAAEKLSGTLDAADNAFYTKGLADTREAAGQVAPASVSDLTSGRVGLGRFVAENFAASAPQTLGTLAGSVAGGVAGTALGGPAGGVAGAIAGGTVAGTPFFVGSNVDRAVQENGDLTDEGAARAVGFAPLQAASDTLVERFLPGAGHVVGGFAARQTGNFLTRTAKSIVKAGATEAVTEAGQQLGERAAAGLPITGPDAAAEYVNSAVTAFAIGGVLGSAGGIRRGPAHVKPAADVTPEDLSRTVDDVLAGTRALPAPEQRLALPAPGQGVPVPAGNDLRRPDAIVDPRGNVAPNTPAGVAALAQTPIADVVVTPQGDALPSPTATDLAAFNNRPVTEEDRRRDALAAIAARGPLPQTGLDVSAPGVSELLARMGQSIPGQQAPTATFDPAVGLDPASSDTSALAQRVAQAGGVAPAVEGVEAPAAPRLFPTEKLSDLDAAIRAKDATPELKAEAQRELETRWQEAAGVAPLTTDNFADRVAEVKHGLRGQFAQKLEAASPDELVTKIYDRVFVDQDTASNVVKLAQRVGLLDADLQPTERANTIEAARTAQDQAAVAPPAPVVGTPVAAAPAESVGLAATQTPSATAAAADSAPPPPPPAPSITPAAPIAPPAPELGFDKRWMQLKTEAGIARQSGAKSIGTPVSQADAEQRVIRALADDKITRNGEASQVERLAQKLGLVTADESMDITPKGRQAYLGTPEGRGDITAAAREQGYTDDAQSTFERGVQAQLGGPEVTSHTSFEDMAAYQAGKVWAQDFVDNATTKTLQQTRAIQDRQAARTNGKAVDRKAIERAPLTPGQIQQRSLNRLLDAADLRTVPDEDVATLRRMVRDGAGPTEVAQALQKVQGGQTLFMQPETTPTELSPKPVRGQPIFKELNTARASDAGLTKAQQRAQNEESVRAYTQRQLIRQALFDKEITVGRAEKLNDMLDEGRVGAVERLTADFGSIKRDATGGTLGAPDADLERALTGKSFSEAVDYMVDNAPSPYMKEVMTGVRDLANKIAAVGGHSFDLRIVNPGDTLRGSATALNSSRLRATAIVSKVPATATVYLKGTRMGPESGLNYQVAAHEMLHAVTMQAISFGRRLDQKSTTLGKAVSDLTALGNAVVNHFNARYKAVGVDGLTDFERAIFNGQNTLHNQDEILAWGLTNPDFQNYLQGIEYKPRQSVFGRLVELVRNLLGVSGKYDTALTELMRVSEQVMGLDARELAPAFVRDGTNANATAVLQANATEAGTDAANRTAEDANSVTTRLSGLVDQLTDRLPISDIKGSGRRKALGFSSMAHLIREYGSALPGMVDLDAAHRQAASIRGRWSAFGDEFSQGLEKLRAKDKARAEQVIQLMAATTEFQLDPDKAFEDHAHLADDPNEAALRRNHAELVRIKNNLSRGEGEGYRLFTAARLKNEGTNLAHLTMELHSLIANDRELSLGVANANVNPMTDFMARTDLTEPGMIRDYWQGALNRQIAAAEAFVRAKMGEVATGTAGEQRGMTQHLSPVVERIQSTREALAGMGRAPYFHLGRFGDNFGSATIRKLEDGTVDPRAQQAVAQALEAAGFRNMQISTDNRNPKIYGRFETRDQAERFKQLMLELHGRDLLHGDADDIKAGPRDLEQNYGVATGLSSFLQKVISSIQTDPRYVPDQGATAEERTALEARKQEAIQAIRDTWVEQQPDNSISKVLTARKTVGGYDPDMERSFAHRTNVGASNLANLSVRADINKAHEAMRSQVVQSLSATSEADPGLVSDVYGEVRKRESLPVLPSDGSFFSRLRSIGHAYFLGFSPSYAAIQIMQVGTGSIPELAKQHGFNKSFHALRRMTSPAIAILKAAGAEASQRGPRHHGDVVISDTVLRSAGLNPRQLEFMRHMLATGQLDIGTAARAQAQVASGRGHTATDTALKYAATFGLYTETFSRLVTALAAHDLHGGDTQSSAKYAGNVITEALYDYQSRNTARQLGKQGFLGQVTPLLTQFMSYSAFTLEKLYSEGLSAIGRARPGEDAATTAQRAKEARTFIVGHLAAMTALAGTLGLPFASVFASTIERLVDSFGGDDEPFDATAAYRNFLASVLGKDAAEVVSRGLPRALGFDISQRVGESDILPFTQLIVDKRNWQQAVQSYFGRSIGASADMTVGILDAGDQLANGDVLAGMKALLPVALKGGVEAYRMSTEGYIDTKGNKLPITPGTAAIMWQLLGFNPSEKAEYSEARGDQQARRVVANQQANRLRQQIVRAIVSGDQETASALIARAQQFDDANPSVAVVPSLATALQRQQASAARARAIGAPLGVAVDDLAGRQLTGYANVSYQ